MTPSTLLSLRRWHRYVGVFLAPAILFFAVTGFIQVIGWQDRRDPPPPAWLSWMAGIHKHQAPPKPRAARPAAPPVDAAPRGGEHADNHDGDHDGDHGGEHQPAFTPLKIFALLTAVGLLGTTLIGLAVALGARSTRRTAMAMLALGVAVPVLLMAV